MMLLGGILATAVGVALWVLLLLMVIATVRDIARGDR